MNKQSQINANAKTKLKEDLVWLGLYNQKCLRNFKLMYSPHNLERPITEIIDNMPYDKLIGIEEEGSHVL